MPPHYCENPSYVQDIYIYYLTARWHYAEDVENGGGRVMFLSLLQRKQYQMKLQIRILKLSHQWFISANGYFESCNTVYPDEFVRMFRHPA